MGIQLKTADITAIKRNETGRRSAKHRYRNNDLPFENSSRDLKTLREAACLTSSNGPVHSRNLSPSAPP